MKFFLRINYKNFLVVLGLILLLFIAALCGYKSANFIKFYNFSTEPVISNFTVKQLPTIPGESIHWVKTVNLNRVNSSEHLLAIPKGASQVKISTSSSKSLSTKSVQTLDKQELSKLALQNSQSEASQALAKQIKKDKATG